MSRAVFHYTTGDRARDIAAYGAILPATACIGAQEHPVVWFSAAQTWEPTATKMLADARGRPVRRATMAEMDRMAGGLFRFARSSDGLVPWPDLARAARIHTGMARRMEKAGREIGALPSDWYGHLGPVSLSQVASIERFQGGRWSQVHVDSLREAA